MKTKRILILLALSILVPFFSGCQEKEADDVSLSQQGFFSQQNYNYNLSREEPVTVPIVRLGTSGDLNLDITMKAASDVSSIFSLPSSVIIADGNRVGNVEVLFDKTHLAYMETYVLNVAISEYSSVYGYGEATLQIANPLPDDLSYEIYGEGCIIEGWWGEEESKQMFYVDCGGGIYKCYLPDCWGHDSGPDYPVQNYVFYWDTMTNKLYIPFQPMGTEDWCIGDQGSIACQFGGPGYAEGLRTWRDYIDEVYKNGSFPQPHYNPETRTFYLSDSAACSSADGAVVYGTPGTPDIFTLQ